MSPLPPTRERPVTAQFHGGDLPGAPTPPTRSTRKWLRRIGIIFIIAIAVMLGAIAAVAFYAKQEIDDLVKADTAAEVATQKQLATPLPGRPTNILVIGSDHRTGFDDTDKRSDTIMLVRLDPKQKTISMLSFPRDTYVEIPGHGEGKINDAYYEGGAALSTQTIKQLTGLDVNFVVDVDFKGFRGVVDTFGGIWVDVDHKYYTPPEADYMEIDIEPGYQLLDGRDALAFARYRHGDSDFHRIARQQLVLAGLKKQVGESSKLNKVQSLFRVLKENTSIVGGGGNEVPAKVIYDYMRLATGLSSKDVYQVEFKGGTGEASNGASIVTFNEDDLEASVAAFLSPSKRAREETADQLVGKAAPSAEAPDGDAQPATETADKAATAPEPSTVSVKVLNGSGMGGAAGNMAGQLAAAGYQVDPNQSNADNANYASTKILYADDAAKPAAEALAKRIKGATTGAKDASNQFSTQVLVIVGRTGTELGGSNAGSSPIGTEGGPTGGTTAEGNTVPEKGDAKVLSDAELAKDQFLEVTSRRFPILYPTVHEETSSYEGAYGYQFARGSSKQVYDAYRLVGKTSTGDYWGLQGTSWANPPILEGATREVTRNGRAYKLYFNGTKLHMVAWRQGTGTYWVANSVLDKLSNETMLAIADGVRPLR
ncbi:MAG: LytR family transcriptional regulator [Thermoleophilia bacterium]|nr:LytR family transcriptional regulator [Thermoleophilia bacterium]